MTITTVQFAQILLLAINKKRVSASEAQALSDSWYSLPEHKKTEAMCCEYIGHILDPNAALDYLASLTYTLR